MHLQKVFHITHTKILLAISGLFFFANMHAQLLVNQGQTITVTGVDLYIGGSATNRGTISNNGIVTVSGDWTNSQTYLAGSGTFILDGDVPQNILHNSDSFHILTLKGAGNKTLSDDALVVQDFQFTNPVVLSTASAGSITILNGATITGAGAAAYVDGLLYHEGLGKKIYPVGVSGRYLPVTLENITADINNPITGIQLFEPNVGATPGKTLASVSQIRYAALSQKQGVLAGTPITLSIGDDETISGAGDVVVAESNAQNGTYHSLGQSVLNTTPGAAFITSNTLLTGSFFAVAISAVLDAGSVYVPSAFSPRATNPEDQVIKIYGGLLEPEGFEFRVFSQWGNVIFESSSLVEMQTTGWRGNDKSTGDIMSNGVYTYSMRGKFYNGKSFEKSGSITIIK